MLILKQATPTLSETLLRKVEMRFSERYQREHQSRAQNLHNSVDSPGHAFIAMEVCPLKAFLVHLKGHLKERSPWRYSSNLSVDQRIHHCLEQM
jgi:hypothetical protein